MSLQFDSLAALATVAILGLLYFLLRWFGRDRPAAIMGFSSLQGFDGLPRTFRMRLLQHLPKLAYLSLGCLVLAAGDPHLLLPIDPPKDMEALPSDPEKKEERVENYTPPTEGVAIYLVLDQSGSMTEELIMASESGKRVRMSRMDALKQVTAQFIKGNKRAGMQGRHQDLLGLVSFARVAHVTAPLTLDHAYVLDVLSQLKPVQRREEDGTAIGYALYKTANLITATRHFAEELIKEGKPAYTANSHVMILVTDGFHYPNPLDKGHLLRTTNLREASEYARDEGIKLYIVNIEPAIAQAKYAGELNSLRDAAERTGGSLFVVGREGSLADIYAAIDQLEASTLPATSVAPARIKVTRLERVVPKGFKRVSLISPLILIALLGLGTLVLLETTYLRGVP